MQALIANSKAAEKDRMDTEKSSRPAEHLQIDAKRKEAALRVRLPPANQRHPFRNPAATLHASPDLAASGVRPEKRPSEGGGEPDRDSSGQA